MNKGKLIGIAASFAIVGAIVYMALGENSSSKIVDKNQTNTMTQAQGDANQAPALSEDEKKIQALKESTQPKDYAVSNLYMVKCKACHGASGKGAVGPSLVGKTEQELLKKLNDYKEGKVKNSLMAGLLVNSTDEELKSLASEISKFGK
ncbi:MAG TPA: c-type cytochrome [Campylobacterales bacterium]|nr:c-type cytochrome [Campylobacterales bacterium]